MLGSVARIDWIKTAGIAFWATIWALCPASSWGQAWVPTPASWVRDSTLRDVFFIDADSGWACGDRGTILRTENGGRTWALVSAARRCRLDSIFFINHNQGWACGGFVSPISDRSQGVVLRTQDGGLTWTETSASNIGWLRRLRFVNPSVGWAVGSVSAHQPSGVFFTRDGGDHWTAASDYAKGSWSDAAAFTDQEMVMVGESDGIQRLRTEQFEDGYLLDGRLPRLRSVTAVDPQRGWAVGERGSIYQTTNQGLSWRQAADPQRIPGLDQLEFSTVTARGPHAWMAGNPGSVIVHTHDGGTSWQWTRSGIDVEIQRLFFVDERRGWAVGGLGKIYSTSDGGLSWQPQRNGPLRLFAMQIAPRAAELPLEAMARFAGNEGWLINTVIPSTRLETDDLKTDATLGQEQWISVTGVAQSCWWTPFHRGLVPVAQQKNDPLAVPTTEQQWDDWKRFLTFQIRVQRPAVLILPAPSHSRTNAGERQFYELCLEACRDAGRRDTHAEQLIQFGLQPWKTPKVFACSPLSLSNGILIPTDQYALKLGRTLQDLCLPSRLALSAAGDVVPKQYQLRLVESELPPATASNSLSSDLSAAWITTSQRPSSPAQAGTLQNVQQLSSTAQLLTQLSHLNEAADPTGAMWMASVRKQLISLDDWSGGNFLFRLAQAHQERQQIRMAARSYRMMMDRYPDHPLSDASVLWLWTFYSSCEWRWLDDPRSEVATIAPLIAAQTVPTATFKEMMQQAKLGEEQEFTSEVIPAGNVESSGVQPLEIGGRRVALPMFEFQAEVMDSAAGEPAQFRMADLQNHEKDDYLQQLERYLMVNRPALLSDWRIRLERLALRQEPAHSEWLAMRDYQSGTVAAIAEQELWLSQPLNNAAPDFLFDIAPVDHPPVLDGRLDEEFWARAWAGSQRIALRLAPDSSIAPSHIMLACDDEFLYVAAVCQKIGDAPYGTVPPKRQRDAPTDQVDHVELLLDPDRDHRTAFRLRFDYHGRGWDGVAENSNWNPQWFVGRHETDSTWTVEAAIPFAQLNWQAHEDRRWWGLGISRSCPGFGSSHWGISEAATDSNTAPLVFGMASVPPLAGVPAESEQPSESQPSESQPSESQPPDSGPAAGRAGEQAVEFPRPLESGLEN